MKKYLFLLFLAVGLNAFAFSFTKSYNSGDLKLDVINQDSTSVVSVSLNDMAKNVEAGAEMLPCEVLFFSIPSKSTDFVVSATPLDSVRIKLDYPIEVATEMGFSGSTKLNTEEFSRPAHICEYSGAQYIKGVFKVIGVSLNPIRYDKQSQIITFYTSIKIDINYSTADDVDCIAVNSTPTTFDIEYVKNIVENPTDVEINTFIPTSYDLSLDNNGIINRAKNEKYAIIAPKRLCNSLRRLAAYRQARGYESKVYSIDSVLSLSYSDSSLWFINDDAGKLRAFIKNLYENERVTHVLLAGKHPEMPIRYAIVDYKNDNTVPTDLYFSDLNASWRNRDGSNGSHNPSTIDFFGEVNIGRLPFETEDEVNSYIDKILKYELNPGNGNLEYLSQAFLSRQYNGNRETFPSYGKSELNNLYDNFNIASKDKFYTGAEVINELNTTPYGVHFFIGHGHPGSISVYQPSTGEPYAIGSAPGDARYTQPENGNCLTDLTNYDTPAWAYSISCTIMPFDTYITNGGNVYDVTKTVGEAYTLGKNGGVALFGNTRVSEVSSGVSYTNTFCKLVVDNISKNAWGRTAGELMTDMRAAHSQDNQYGSFIYTYQENATHNLFGDPLCQLWIDTPKRPTVKMEPDDKYNQIWYTINGLEDVDYICSVSPLRKGEITYQTLMNKKKIESLGINFNCVYSIYRNNSIPVFLPTFVQNFTFDAGTGYYTFGDLAMGQSIQVDYTIGKVVFPKNSTINIEVLGDALFGSGIVFEEGSNIDIYVHKDATILDLNIPKGVTLNISTENASILGNITQENGSSFTLIERSNHKKASQRKENTSNEAKMVVEGRTWWYNVEYTMPWFESHEFGVRIGEEVVIDGVAWRTMELVGGYERHRTTDPLKGEELEMSEWKAIDENGMIIGYIREEDNTVFTKETDRISGYEALDQTCSVLVGYHEGVNKLYRFGKPGDVFAVGEDSYYHNFEITSAETIESVGREYTLYNTKWVSTYPKNTYGEYLAYFEDQFCIIEGIGPTDGTIFGPVGSYKTSIPYWTVPRLRYVTEGEGNEIIFEYLGGEKAWELSGVDAPIADNLQNAPKQWFNLQGIAIEQPSTPGVYIVKQGNKTFKTRIR